MECVCRRPGCIVGVPFRLSGPKFLTQLRTVPTGRMSETRGAPSVEPPTVKDPGVNPFERFRRVGRDVKTNVGESVRVDGALYEGGD